MSVFDHDVRTEPETNPARVVGNFGLGPNVIRYEEVRVHFFVIPVVLLFKHSNHLEGPLDFGQLSLKTGLLAD